MKGRIISGADNADALVEHVVIGAMGVESALNYLKRRERTALITGGDRTDLLTAALNNPEVAEATACFILTGDLYPSPRILSRAAECGIPCMLVPHDTPDDDGPAGPCLWQGAVRPGAQDRTIQPSAHRSLRLPALCPHVGAGLSGGHSE